MPAPLALSPTSEGRGVGGEVGRSGDGFRYRLRADMGHGIQQDLPVHASGHCECSEE